MIILIFDSLPLVSTITVLWIGWVKFNRITRYMTSDQEFFHVQDILVECKWKQFWDDGMRH
jgi:hypothetical protein